MARPLRVEFPGALYLVTAQALPRQKLFRDVEESADFVSRLPELGEAFGAVFHGFCLLPNHYHLLVETPRGNLSRVIHRLNAGYTATVNARRRRTGPLLRGRYRSLLLEADPWLLRLSLHVHLNPVRRGVALDPWTYEGSSARAFVPGSAPVPGVETDRVLKLAGGSEAYAELLAQALASPPEAPWGQVWRQSVLGGEALRGKVLEALAAKDSREIPGFGREREGCSVEEVVALVAEHTGVRPQEILRSKFQRVLARKVALHLARRFTGLTLREIGVSFGVDYTTVHMATRRLEELRARDPSVAEFVSVLEAELREKAAPPLPEPERPASAVKPSPRKKRGEQKKEEKKPTAQLKLF